MRKIEPGRTVAWGDKWLAIRAGLLMPVVEVWMRRTSLKRCQRGLAKWAGWMPPYTAKAMHLKRAQAIAALVFLGNQRYSIYPADCLTRSLVLQYFITRLGGQAALCLGVRTITGQFEAHAWVEFEGAPLNELETVREIYTSFDWTRPPGH